MNTLLERLMGVDTLTDQVIAMDLLTSAKSAIIMYAIAATEAATPAVRATFEQHLEETIETHARLTEYMIAKGFYHAYDTREQIQLDRTTIKTALSIPS